MEPISASPAPSPNMLNQTPDGVAATAILNSEAIHEKAALGAVEDAQQNGGHKHARQFGSHPHTERFRPHAASNGTYEEKYPPDKPGEELNETARVWRIYSDEAQEIDNEMIQEYKESIDILLVFAGLFSAVSTAFIIQAFQSAQTDYAQVSALFLSVVVREQFNNSALLSTLPSHESLALSSTNHLYIVNRLWYSSLLISLATALLGILAKQWLVAFRLPSKARSPKQWALWHQFRINGFETWQVPFIISLLPFLLHLSLLLFAIGLVLFLQPFDIGSRNITLGFLSVTAGIYLLATFLPVAFPACPYRTRLFEFIRYNIIKRSFGFVHRFIISYFPIIRILYRSITDLRSTSTALPTPRLVRRIINTVDTFFLYERTPGSPSLNIHDFELKRVDMQTDILTSLALRWLAISSPLEEVFTAVTYSVAAAVPGTRLAQEMMTREMGTILVHDLTQRHPLWCNPCTPESQTVALHDVALAGAYLRALVNSTAPYYSRAMRAEMPSLLHSSTTDSATRWKVSLGCNLVQHFQAGGAINDDVITALLAILDIRHISVLQSFRQLGADWPITRCCHLFYTIAQAPSQDDDPFAENTTCAALLVAELVHQHRHQIGKLIPYTLEIIGAVRNIYRKGFPDNLTWAIRRLMQSPQTLERLNVCHLIDVWSWLATKLDTDEGEYNPTLLLDTIVSLLQLVNSGSRYYPLPFDHLQNLLTFPRIRGACGWDPLRALMYLQVAPQGFIMDLTRFNTMIHALLIPWQGDEPTLPVLLEYIYDYIKRFGIETPRQTCVTSRTDTTNILRATILLQSLLQTLPDQCSRLMFPIILYGLSLATEPSLTQRVHQIYELGEDRATREDLLALLRYAEELLPVLTETPPSRASGESLGSCR